MTVVRLGAIDKQEVINWLENNVGPTTNHELILKGVMHTGPGWCLVWRPPHTVWRPFGSGWFMEVTFDDPKVATMFSLRWK